MAERPPPVLRPGPRPRLGRRLQTAGIPPRVARAQRPWMRDTEGPHAWASELPFAGCATTALFRWGGAAAFVRGEEVLSRRASRTVQRRYVLAERSPASPQGTAAACGRRKGVFGSAQVLLRPAAGSMRVLRFAGGELLPSGHHQVAPPPSEPLANAVGLPPLSPWHRARARSRVGQFGPLAPR
jgi:hypothetical protein